MKTDHRITAEELAGMFGGSVPWEAMELIWNAPETMTVGEVREKLRKLGPARRARIDLQTPAEAAIRAAMAAVEEAGCDVRLTDAVALLDAALESVADFVDGVKPMRRSVRKDPWSGE